MANPAPPDLETRPDEPLSVVLNDLRSLLRRFVRLQAGEYVAIALWVAYTHVVEAFEIAPRLHITSPEKRAGKSTLVNALEWLVDQPLPTMNITVAALARTIAARHPTVLFDEADGTFSAKADRAELTSIINAGYSRRGRYFRCNKDKGNVVESFSVFAPMALAGIRGLPDTIVDRSVVIQMRRITRAEKDSLNGLREEAWFDFDDLRLRLAAWAARHVDDIDPHVDVPEGLESRPADVWQVLIAMADAAGDSWPRWARLAALELDAARQEADDTSGKAVLTALRRFFDHSGQDRMPSEALCSLLEKADDVEDGWIKRDLTCDGKKLADALKPYGIKPKTMRFDHLGNKPLRGYERAAFEDAWARYVPDPEPGEDE